MPKSSLKIVQKYYPGVTRVVDAKKDTTVRITPTDCRHSRKKSPEGCAMAKACKRDFDGAIISLHAAYLVQGKTAKRYVVPIAVAREIVSFDRNHDFRPGTYSLKRPSKSQSLRPLDRELNPNRHKAKYVKVKRRNHKTSGIRAL